MKMIKHSAYIYVHICKEAASCLLHKESFHCTKEGLIAIDLWEIHSYDIANNDFIAATI